MSKKDLRPSNTERFFNCTLWLNLPKSPRPKQKIKYLEERTKDHERLEKGEFKETEQSCKKYEHDVLKGCQVYREARIDIELNGHSFGGTPDIYAYDKKKKLMHIIDYKTGFHVVEANRNPQLLSYAVLVMESLEGIEIDHFVLSILNVQRDMPLSYIATKEQVCEHKKRLEKTFKNINQRDLFIAKKGSWCSFCDSKYFCPLQREKEAVEYTVMDTDKLMLEVHRRKDQIFARKRHLRETRDPSKVFEYKVSEKGVFSIVGENQ